MPRYRVRAEEHEAKARALLINRLGEAGDFAPHGFRQAFHDSLVPPPPAQPAAPETYRTRLQKPRALGGRGGHRVRDGVPRQNTETPESSGLSSLAPEPGPSVGAFR